MEYAVSQEQMVYKAIDSAAQTLNGSGVGAQNLIYFLRRNGRDICHIQPVVPTSRQLSSEAHSRIDDFAKLVNKNFAELKLGARIVV